MHRTSAGRARPTVSPMRGLGAGWTLAVVAAATLVLAGCGGALRGTIGGPGDPRGASRLARRYPAADFITAEGVSEQGFAQAEARARAEVAAQIRSELTAVLTTELASTSRDGEITDYQRLVSETSTRTSFAHAEMIRLDPAGRRFERGAYHAFALLPRAEAAGPLARDYEAAAQDFRAAAEALQAPASDLPAWTATLRRAEAGFARLSDAAFGLRAVSRREHAAYLEDLARYERAERERAARLSGLRLVLRIEGDTAAAVRLARVTSVALARLGLGTRGGDCPDGGYELCLRPEVRWSAGPLGPVCRLGLSGTLAACPGEHRVARLALEDPDFSGTDPRDRDQALGVLWERVTEDRLEPLLRRELALYLPIAER